MGQTPQLSARLVRVGLQLLVFLLAGAGADPQSLQLQPNSVRAGKDSTLTWDTKESPAFIVG